jgi:hypothetical protein
MRERERECVFPCILGTFRVKEYLLVLWVYLALKRECVFTGARGTIRMILGAVHTKNGVFTSALSNELGWKYSGLKSGHI